MIIILVFIRKELALILNRNAEINKMPRLQANDRCLRFKRSRHNVQVIRDESVPEYHSTC